MQKYTLPRETTFFMVGKKAYLLILLAGVSLRLALGWFVPIEMKTLCRQYLALFVPDIDDRRSTVNDIVSDSSADGLTTDLESEWRKSHGFANSVTSLVRAQPSLSSIDSNHSFHQVEFSTDRHSRFLPLAYSLIDSMGATALMIVLSKSR